MYQRFQSLPASKFALSLFVSLNFSDLTLLAIKCQHLFPFANILHVLRPVHVLGSDFILTN